MSNWVRLSFCYAIQINLRLQGKALREEDMALIECDECGKDVSDKAVSCPNCGNPIAISEAVADDLQDDFVQNPKGEAIEEYKKKYSNLKRGLKRISIFASIIWAGCWYYNQEVTLKNWFGIYYGSDEYIYLGLFGLICIWVTQLFAYCLASTECGPTELKS